MKKNLEIPELDPGSYKPLYIQLSEILINHAKESGLKNGEALPSENELLARFKVSRNTIRQAVDRLVHMGFATKIRGQGTFITKDDEACPIDYDFGFEGSLRRMGMQASNRLIELVPAQDRLLWTKGLGTIDGGDPVLIRRMKIADNELVALEDRLLPSHVPSRYTQKELEEENINPDLLDQYPDTQTKRFRYIFASQPLDANEKQLFDLPPDTRLLRRIGEYYNAIGKLFMIGRLTVILDRITLWYEYEKKGNEWVIK